MSIGPIAFQGDPLIPVMEGMGALLSFNDLDPGVLPGRLVEMTVNGYKGVFHLWAFAKLIELSYITPSISKQFLIQSL